MKRAHKILVGIAAALLLGGLWVVLQPGPSYDPGQVHPALLDLSQPYQEVKAYFFTDGGSIGIEVVGHDGRSERFALPAHLGEPDRHTKVFFGAIYDRRPGAVEIPHPEHTKRMLTCILRDKPNRTPQDDACLMLLRRYPKDFVRVLYHRWRGRYELP